MQIDFKVFTRSQLIQLDTAAVVPSLLTLFVKNFISGEKRIKQRIFEYRPAMLHRKVMVIDDLWVSVGSANCLFSRVTPHGGKPPPHVDSKHALRCVHLNQPTNKFYTVNTSIHSEPPMNQLSEAAREIANRAADAAKETAHRATVAARDFTGAVEDVAKGVTNSARDATDRATDTARELYQSAALRAEDTLATSKEYVRRNPVPVVLGAVAFGVAIGYMLVMARRKQTFSERYADEPMVAVREAILGSLAPVAQRVQKGYDSAMDGAGKAIERVHSFGPGRSGGPFSDQIGRIGNNLKFW